MACGDRYNDTRTNHPISISFRGDMTVVSFLQMLKRKRTLFRVLNKWI